MIRRHKTTIFTDAKESSTVFELKRIVEGILKRPPEEQRLYKVRRAGVAVARAGVQTGHLTRRSLDRAEEPAASGLPAAAPPCQAVLLSGWGNRGLDNLTQPKVVAEPGFVPG
jgi:hypothetical protein